MFAQNKNAVVYLSLIMGLRMLGLFMVLPLFMLHAQGLTSATPFLCGIAMSIYGLSQAVFQIPFGTLSDRFGRKPIIAFGLVIFMLGSIVAGFAHSIFVMILGRALQGVGAVGSTILAFLADLTPPDKRTKSMAIAGMTIGASFCLALLSGPLLVRWFQIATLFYIAAGFALFGLYLLFYKVPQAPVIHQREQHYFKEVFCSKALLYLNMGIFILHAIFTATFVILPISLVHHIHLPADNLWRIFLPTLLIGFIVSFVAIGIAERKKQIQSFYIAAILLLGLSEIILWQATSNIIVVGLALTLFFSGGR